MASQRYLQGVMMSVLFLWCALAPSGKGYSGGTGRSNDPYLIATPQDLIDLGQNPDDYNKHFRLTADIDLSAYTFDRAVIAPDNGCSGWIDPHGPSFAGVFDGNAHVIRHLRIEGEDYLGLFGSLAPRAVVRNLGIEDYSVQGEDCIGSLTAKNHGTVSDCHSSGAIAANCTIGGLVGSNDGGRMLNCHSVGEIIAKWDCVGGLAGCNSGIVLDCHSEVTITSPDGCDLGGLVGSASADSVEHSFWDIQTSGQTVSATGTGLRTSEMWDIDTFLEAGWQLRGRDDQWHGRHLVD